MIVVDTNVIAYLFIKGSSSKSAEKLLKTDSEWISSPLWRSEFRSVLSLYLRKKEISLKQAQNIAQLAEEFMQDREFQPDSDLILELVSTSKCSSYDCEFVALAKSLDLFLYTSDQKILKEFPKLAKSIRNI